MPYIDGVRAIAVISVLGFHAGLPGFTGGFVGVDVFFVISGFLMTGQIADELDAGTFSLTRFYSRRILRILPPLLLVIVAVLVAAAVVPLLPVQLDRIALAGVWSVSMLANWYFYRQSGYFAPSSDSEPFLHVWSLSVEEQFYVLVPIGLLVLYLVARRIGIPSQHVLIVATGATLALSLATALPLSHANPEYAFYSTGTRMWEFCAGGLSALLVRIGLLMSRRAAHLAGLVSVVAIVASVPWLETTPQHPAARLTLPVMATAVLLAAGTMHPQPPIFKLLALAPLAGIGLISYGWYLWHWPLVVFLGLTQMEPMSTWQRLVAVVALPLPLALATYFGIEKPLRNWRRNPRATVNHRAVVAGAVAASAAAAVCALGLNAWSSTLAERRDIQPFHDASIYAWEPCPARSIGMSEPRCRIGTDASVRVLVWGDSHAGSLATAVGAAAVAAGASAVLSWDGQCPALVDLPMVAKDLRNHCGPFNDAVLRWLTSDAGHTVKAVVIGTRWSGLNPSAGTLEQALRETVGALTTTGRRVLIGGPVPQFPYPVATCAFNSRWRGLDLRRCGVARHDIDALLHDVSAALHAATAGVPGVRLIDPTLAFCDRTWCQVDQHGAILFTDDDHISRAGGRVLYDRFREEFSWVFQP